MHAPLSTLCFALLVLFLSSLPTTSAWAIAFFEKDDCWGDAYSVHSGDDNFSGEHPGYTRPGENADNQKCYWNKDWGLIQEPCTVATAPVPKSFFISSNTGCVMGVLSEVKDKFFGDTTPGECNSLKHFRGKAALKRDPNLVFRCRSLAVMAQQDPHVVKKIGVYPTPSNGIKYSNTTGGAVTETDDEWDDDEDYLEEVPEEDVAYDMWGNLLTPTEGATNATAGVNASQG